MTKRGNFCNECGYVSQHISLEMAAASADLV